MKGIVVFIFKILTNIIGKVPCKESNVFYQKNNDNRRLRYLKYKYNLYFILEI